MTRMKDSMSFMALVWIVFMVLLAGTSWGGSLEPSSPPGPTMKTLDEIPPTWSQVLPASTRFVLVLGGAGVLDKETGLVWEQSPSIQKVAWLNAVSGCLILTKGNRMGWRLPSIEELCSLIDPTQINPALPNGHPFINVQYATDSSDEAYWSISNSPLFGDLSVFVKIFYGSTLLSADSKMGNSEHYRWCVRGGHGIDPFLVP